jgi:uncharacterized protein
MVSGGRPDLRPRQAEVAGPLRTDEDCQVPILERMALQAASSKPVLPVDRSGAPSRAPTVHRLRAVAAQVFGARPTIQLAYLFGSVARDQALPTSDIDIAVVVDDPSPLDRLEFEFEIADAVEAATGMASVEVHVVNDAPLLLQGAVVTEGILLHARDEPTRITFEASTRSRYFDYLPAAKAMAATFAKSLRKRLAPTPDADLEEWPL